MIANFCNAISFRGKKSKRTRDQQVMSLPEESVMSSRALFQRTFIVTNEEEAIS